MYGDVVAGGVGDRDLAIDDGLISSEVDRAVKARVPEDVRSRGVDAGGAGAVTAIHGR